MWLLHSMKRLPYPICSPSSLCGDGSVWKSARLENTALDLYSTMWLRRMQILHWDLEIDGSNPSSRINLLLSSGCEKT